MGASFRCGDTGPGRSADRLGDRTSLPPAVAIAGTHTTIGQLTARHYATQCACSRAARHLARATAASQNAASLRYSVSTARGWREMLRRGVNETSKWWWCGPTRHAARRWRAHSRDTTECAAGAVTRLACGVSLARLSACVVCMHRKCCGSYAPKAVGGHRCTTPLGPARPAARQTQPTHCNTAASILGSCTGQRTPRCAHAGWRRRTRSLCAQASRHSRQQYA